MLLPSVSAKLRSLWKTLAGMRGPRGGLSERLGMQMRFGLHPSDIWVYWHPILWRTEHRCSSRESLSNLPETISTKSIIPKATRSRSVGTVANGWKYRRMPYGVMNKRESSM